MAGNRKDFERPIHDPSGLPDALRTRVFSPKWLAVCNSPAYRTASLS